MTMTQTLCANVAKTASTYLYNMVQTYCLLCNFAPGHCRNVPLTVLLQISCKLLRCCCHQYLLGCRLHTWLGFQRLYSGMLLVQAAARSAASVCDQWLNRPPVQLTLSAAVSCIPTFWFHGASHLRQNLHSQANRAHEHC